MLHVLKDMVELSLKQVTGQVDNALFLLHGINILENFILFEKQ